MVYGYVRVSSVDQNEARQLDELAGMGIAPGSIFMDKCSGKDFERPAYRRLVGRLEKGDMLVVKSIDRLGRNYREIIDEWNYMVNDIGVDIRVLDMPLLDTSVSRDLLGTLISDIVLQLLSFVAENERENIRRRQAEGIAAARRRGVRFGRPMAPMTEGFDAALDMWLARMVTTTKAAELAGMPRSTFYRRAMMMREAGRAVEGTWVEYGS